MEKELTKESVFIIGKVFSVDGRIVKIKVNKNKNTSHIVFKGRSVKNISVGSFVKIIKGFVEIIGKVEGEFITEEKSFNPEYKREETKINRILQVSLFGHFDGPYFKQGIKEMPLVDNECYLLDRDEFNSLHSFFREQEKTIKIGQLTEEPSQVIALSINKLFASHIGIFGNTGSGKSNTVARIYTELFRECENQDNFKLKSKFALIDFNGEYTRTDMITKEKDIYWLSTRRGRESARKYKISKDAIRRVEILSVLLSATEKTQTPFLDRAISNDFLDDSHTFNAHVIINLENICRGIIKKGDKAFGGVGIFLELFKDLTSLVKPESSEILRQLKDSIETNLHCHSNGDYYWGASTGSNYDNTTPIYDNRIKSNIDQLLFKDDEFSKLKLKIILNYFFEIVKGFSNQEHIRPLIGRMFKKFNMLEKMVEIEGETNSSGAQNKNLTIISLRDVNIEMKKIIPLIICKQLYDEKKEEDEKIEKSLHIIIDEAHNILSTMSQRESETWKDYRLETFEEIIKEGRKFGTFLTVASQRPYDISPTIISQLHNYFIHRLINDNDIRAIEKAVAYLDKLSFQSIPILSVGSCFVAGLASDLPVKVDINLLEEKQQPKSETINLQKSWFPKPATS